MSKSFAEITAALAEPFPASHVEWRIQHANKEKTRGLAVPYIQSRAIQSRLDQAVGPYNWKAEYKPWHGITVNSKEDGQKHIASQLCGLAIYCEERGEWIQKWDGAENTDIEPVKGGISDSFKRAAVLWGIGRYLYGLDAAWVEIEQRGKSYAITDNGFRQLTNTYENAVKVKPPASGAPSAPNAEPPPFEYAVRTVEERQFSSGNGMVLQLKSADGKKNVEAFLAKADQNLSEGVCLKNVQLRLVDIDGHKCTIIDAYEAA